MIVGVVDVGSNTARLLVAEVKRGNVEELARERVYLRLGDDVHARGRIGRAKLAETARVAHRFARSARKNGAERIETIVTAPARQAANGDELAALLASETGAPVLRLSGDDEGRLAWQGAVARMTERRGEVAVVDLGGGSCEVATGAARAGVDSVRSFDIGALRMTREYLGSSNLRKGAREARRHVETLLTGNAPAVDSALVVGGTARAIGRVLGEGFGAGQLDALVEILERVPSETFIRSHGVSPERAQTLLGGTIVLAEVARYLDSELEVGRGGLREGAALSLAAEARAAA